MTEEIKEEKVTHCYKHTDIEAVGACLACGKALCETCGEWFNGRFYCVDCYTTVELMHAQAQTPKLSELKWFLTPSNIIAFIFIAACLLFIGRLLYSMHREIIGTTLMFSGWILLGLVIPLIRRSPAFNQSSRFLFCGFIYLTMFLVVVISVLVILTKANVIHLF